MIVGLVYSSNMQQNSVMENPEIIIRIQDENSLLTKEEIETFLRLNDLYEVGMKYNEINFGGIESKLKSKSQIADVNVYSQIGNKWMIDIQQRKPIVRVFDKQNNSFYIDENGAVINLKSCNCYSSKVLIANGDIRIDFQDSIINNKRLKTNSLVQKIYRISKYICKDPFLSAQVNQIYLREDGDFILIPQIGDQIIVFGQANSDSEVVEKFEKLITFYKEGIQYEGWDKYSEINLKFNGQIVCKKK